MKKGFLISSGIIVVLIATMSPYFCGNALEDRFNEKVTELQNTLRIDPYSKIETTEYIKGWFSSSAKTVLTVKGQQFVMNHRIVHGPWRYFGLGKIQTTFEMSDKVKPTVDKLFAGKAPLVIDTRIGFSGYDAITISSPTIVKQSVPNLPINSVSWGGMKGDLKFVGDRLIADINIPEFIIEDEYQQVRVKNINLQGDAIYLYNNMPSAVSKNWTGNVALNIGDIAVATAGEVYSTALNLVVNTKDEDKGTIDYDTNVKFTNIKLPAQVGINVSANDVVEFGASFAGIPKQPLAEMIAYLEQIQKSGRAPKQMEMVLAGQNFATALLQGTPSITVHSLVKGDNGNAAITTEAKLAKADSNTKLDQLVFSALNRLVITITPSFSETLLDDANVAGQLPMGKEEFIKTITQNNRFILKNGEYSGKFEYQQGRYYSNGQLDNELQEFLQQNMPRNLLRF